MTTCAMRFTPAGSRMYFVDGKEVDEWTYQKGIAKELVEARRRPKQNGKRFRTPGLFGDVADWRGERDRKTGKDGRYCPQLARRIGDPEAVVRSKSELIEKAKRRGMVVDHSD